MAKGCFRAQVQKVLMKPKGAAVRGKNSVLGTVADGFQRTSPHLRWRPPWLVPTRPNLVWTCASRPNDILCICRWHPQSRPRERSAWLALLSSRFCNSDRFLWSGPRNKLAWCSWHVPFAWQHVEAKKAHSGLCVCESEKQELIPARSLCDSGSIKSIVRLILKRVEENERHRSSMSSHRYAATTQRYWTENGRALRRTLCNVDGRRLFVCGVACQS